MKIKALIDYCEFDIPSSVSKLKSWVKGYDLEDASGRNLQEDIFYVYFRNPYIRYPNLRKLLNIIEAKDDYPCVYSGNELIGVSKKYLNTPYIMFNDFPVEYEKPDHEPIPIIMYVHKRAQYLKLSLNSLIYSLGDDVADLTLFMSAPSIEVEDIIWEMSDKYPGINVYKSERNIACAAINAYLQIRRPKNFILFEEDFILPQYTRYALPYWNRQFNYLLDKYDIVNFQTSLENQNFHFFRGSVDRRVRQTPFSFKPIWITDKQYDVHITGNGFATSARHYASLSDNPPFYISGDGAVYTAAKSICVSSIHGYHLGWNQEMDMDTAFADRSRFPEPGPIQKVVDCKAKKEYIIDLRKVMELK